MRTQNAPVLFPVVTPVKKFLGGVTYYKKVILGNSPSIIPALQSDPPLPMQP
jgi:hypothetical protein